MVYIKNFKVQHDKFHRELLRRKNPTNLWGSPFENALVLYSLINHIPKDEPLINELLSWLQNWSKDRQFIESKEIATAGLYAHALKERKNNNVHIVKDVTNSLSNFAGKEETKFSIFNNPELFFCSTICLDFNSLASKTLKEKISQTLSKEISDTWLNKIVRFVFFTASMFELKWGIDNSTKEKINIFITRDIKSLDHYELICLLWFLGRYGDILSKNQDSLMDSLLDRFSNLKTYFTFVPDSKENGLIYVTTTQLILLDDALNSLTRGFKIDPMDKYNLLDMHPEIKKASEDLFKDGHYSEAIEAAYKRIITLVKDKTGRPKKSDSSELDGKSLMLRSFSRDNPLLKLNDLSTDGEKDEQEGFMHLFAGAVQGIRNPRAHDNIEQNDPDKTLEYLMFASLLARKIDEAKLNESKES